MSYPNRNLEQNQSKAVPEDVFTDIDADAEQLGGHHKIPDDELNAIGRTMFDLPNSKDNHVIVLTPPDNISEIPSQALLRIISKKRHGEIDRKYVGIVVGGPFSEPDGLKADSPIMVTSNVRGGILMPNYHGRANVEILGEIMENGRLTPSRFRPLPNSSVFTLSDSETSNYLALQEGIQLGLVLGYEKLDFGISPHSKQVLPRHLGILGTTGGGKSTTVSRLINEFQKKDIATIVFDTEGEYTEIMEQTDDDTMLDLLHQRKLQPEGVKEVQILRLLGRGGTNETYEQQKEFSLSFDILSPYAVMEILELNDAQQTRYLEAYDAAKAVLAALDIFPSNANRNKDEKLQFELDELESGYPRLTLSKMYWIVRTIARIVNKEDDETIKDEEFKEKQKIFLETLKKRQYSSHISSWRKIQGALSKLLRLNIFDNSSTAPNYKSMTSPGQVTIIDLSDTTSPQVNNLVIAEILRGIQEQQEENYKKSQELGENPHRVMVMIEEAHEFLSRQRIQQMPTLFEQVAKIAKRGRKRWLGLVFITQLPQHLPDEVLALLNSYILHKIGDANTISTLKRSIGGVDEALWERVRNLAPGQAIVRIEGVSRPLMVAIDPTPCKLRMID
jgi:DNA helicase HerA-like ATPase